MHIYAHTNKAKQMKINLVNTTYTPVSQHVTRFAHFQRILFPQLPCFYSTFSSSYHGHDYLEVHVGSSPSSPESQLPRDWPSFAAEKLLVRLAWPKYKRLKKERQHKQKSMSKCSQVQLKMTKMTLLFKARNSSIVIC